MSGTIKMKNHVKTFKRDEDGAVTVDWVILTAAVVGLAAGAYTLIETNTNTLANNIAATVDAFDTTAEAGDAGVAGQ